MQELYAATSIASSLFQLIRDLEVQKQKVIRFGWKDERAYIEIYPGDPAWEEGIKGGFRYANMGNIAVIWRIEK